MPPKQPAPRMKLGHQASNGISASIYGLVERGLGKRPRIAKVIRGTVEFRFKEDIAPVRVRFGAKEVLVEDVQRAGKADLVIQGALPDVVQLTSAPMFGTLARVAGGRVKIEGSPLLARRVLKLLEI